MVPECSLVARKRRRHPSHRTWYLGIHEVQGQAVSMQTQPARGAASTSSPPRSSRVRSHFAAKPRWCVTITDVQSVGAVQPLQQ